MAGRSGSPPAPRERPFYSTAGLSFAAGFMALFLAAGLLTSLANPALLAGQPGSVLDGSWAESYQQAFDEQSPLLTPATTAWAVLEYGLFRQGRPGVLVGVDGWLYSSEEFALPPDDPMRSLEADLELIAEVRERLDSADVRLLVAIVPAKAQVHTENLGRYRLPDLARQRYDIALASLERLGVEAVDLREPLLEFKELGGQPFLRTDTHWTPAGARMAAQSTARRAEEAWDFAWLDDEAFHSAAAGSVSHRGDLTRFIPLGPLYDTIGPPDDRLAQVTTRSAVGPGNDLFADVRIPVTLVGTSYSHDARWNFAGFLREELGSDVLLAAEQGRGPFEPMNEYLVSDAFRNSKPDLVIWEVPERYLGQARERAGGGE